MEHSEDLRNVSEVQLIYRTTIKPSQRPRIHTSKDAYDILLRLWDRDSIYLIEQFYTILLNRRNAVLGVYLTSSGGMTGTVADPKLILVAALKSTATAIILAHNHPSGSLMPSTTDLHLTEKIKHAASFLDVVVADHLILSEEGYYSLADEGLI